MGGIYTISDRKAKPSTEFIYLDVDYEDDFVVRRYWYDGNDGKA
jgi:hypothetical protein